MRLYIARHGETIENTEGILVGQLPGKLSAQGIEQAQELGKLIPVLNPLIIFTSDLERAHVTSTIAAYAGRYTGNIIPDPRLREVNLGELQGKTEEEVRALCQQRGLNDYTTLTHGDLRYFLAAEREHLVQELSCEPTSHINKRLEEVITEMIQSHARQLGDTEGIILVAHAAYDSYLIEKLLYGTCGVNLKKRSEGGHFHQGNGELSMIDFNHNGEVMGASPNVPFDHIPSLLKQR